MKKHFTLSMLSVAVLLVSGCSTYKPERTTIDEGIDAEVAVSKAQVHRAELKKPVAESAAEVRPNQVNTEPTFDLVLTDANAREVFTSLVTDTPWSLVLHPDVKGTITTTLRGVTVKEALESLRDMYGYDFQLQGRRISVYPTTAQTRSFVINYLNASRNGRSDSRVNLGGNATGTGTPATQGTTGNSAPAAQSTVSTQIQTTTNANLWNEMIDTVKSIVGTAPGRTVLATPQANLLTVRAMPDELRQVEQYLSTVRGSVERQVMLEAKIIDVELNDSFQSGVDWTRLFARGKTVGSAGFQTSDNGITRALPGVGKNDLGNLIGLPSLGAGAFGLSLGTANFELILSFLESFGNTRVLSSPRVASLNNQRALLKVGNDRSFITSATPGSTVQNGTGSPTVNPPTLNWERFFSGISLDVTPQIDESNSVMMHVRPSVSVVTAMEQKLDLGTAGSYNLPTASSNVNETDTFVKVPDGQIVAIGGLMQMETSDGASGVPGATRMGPLGSLLSNQARSGHKRELIVLIKPTVIKSEQDWAKSWNNATLKPSKVIEIQGSKVRGNTTLRLSNELLSYNP